MNLLFHILIASFVFLSSFSCSTVPLTGRKQLNLMSDSEMFSMSYSQYDQFLKENKVSEDKEKTAMVKSVGMKIQTAVTAFMNEKGLGGELEGYQWEFNLIESDQINAWCMPGGKVVFYTGIMPVCQDETGIAVVMGHEVAHAVAEHGAERMSQGLLAQFGGAALSVALSKEPTETQALWMTAYGVGAQYGVLLPYGRTQESESDHLGLIFMAMAGYDPNAGVGFWERMAAQGGEKPPEILSTHPSDETRIAEIKKHLPEALQYYKPN